MITATQALLQGCLIRAVEETLLELFSSGKVSGTTHTCIGQEMAAVALAHSLDREVDIVVSNHRCHGHYLAWTDDVEGLVAEVMGKASGVCGGLGGSQHLCSKGFFSNGVQGGIAPVAAGLAFGLKMAATRGIVAVCIGDGTLGEGVIYETFNLASKWKLPLLIVLENNGYAQSTAQTETLAGDICARASAFGIRVLRGSTWEYNNLLGTMQTAAQLVRSEVAPVFVRVDTYRLAAHSKGDDDRDPAELCHYRERDPVLMGRSFMDAKELALIQTRIAGAVEKASAAPYPTLPPTSSKLRRGASLIQSRVLHGISATSQLDQINAALSLWLEEDASVVLLGEDIRSPYGGAFKVTRGLSNAHPTRVLNTPISEAAIVGVANGLSLAGWRPVVEVMFGDFLGLCFDQILNHAAKFHAMYNQKVSAPVVIRTPMGGGRGYGPTHSQNIEKHFVGIPGTVVLIMHARTDVPNMYRVLRNVTEPVLLVENKLLYRQVSNTALSVGYVQYQTTTDFPTVVIRPAAGADLTIVALGRMSVLAEEAVAMLLEDEIFVELILPLQIYPFDAAVVVESVQRTGKLMIVEEGASGFDLGSEIVASTVCSRDLDRRIFIKRLGAKEWIIPSSIVLEREVLLSTEKIVAAALELFDE